jgi:hypothetical protein
MKRVLVLALMLGAVSAAMLTAQTRPAAEDDAVMKADHALVSQAAPLMTAVPSKAKSTN